jgi:dihydroorotase
MDGIIDCIASHHFPQEKDSKVVEFEYAKYGSIGLQTSFAAVRTVLPELSIEKLVALFTSHPRKIFDLPVSTIKENEPACFTLFTDEEWVFNKEDIRSKSSNTPFIGKSFRGKPFGIINKDQVFLNE